MLVYMLRHGDAQDLGPEGPRTDEERALTPEGAAIVSVEDFRQGRDIRFDKAAPVECHHQIYWRAHQSVSRMSPYDLWNRNCEHYATWLMGEKPQSPQVNGAVLLGLLGTVLWLTQ